MALHAKTTVAWSGARLKWMFTTQKARQKLARAYPDNAKESKSLCGAVDQELVRTVGA
jgi:hypothetical protein